MTDLGLDPLHRFQVARTSNPEELRQLGPRLLGASRIELRNVGAFDARLNAVELESIGIGFSATSSDVVADQFASDLIRLQIAIKGRGLSCVGAKVTELNEQQFAVAPAGIPWQMVAQGGHERLTVRFNQQLLMNRLTALVGTRPKADYQFDGAIAADNPQARGLARLLQFVSRQINDSASTLAPPVYRELEDAVHVAFLSASRHQFRELLTTPGLMPDFKIVKRIEAFVEAHWREAITIERLVNEAGISARSLFRAFARIRGYSPMAFAKSIRLQRARALLLSGDPTVTVASAATACNFVNPGHFARYYREIFGELPSATVSRGGS